MSESAQVRGRPAGELRFRRSPLVWLSRAATFGVAVALTASLGIAPVSASTLRPAATTTAKVTLTELDYWTGQPENGAVTKLLDACATQIGNITISRTPVPEPQLLPTILRDAQSRTLPDLVAVDNPDLQELASTGAFAPLTKVPTTGILSNVLAAGSYQGKLYGAAPGINDLGLFYNKTMLAAAHITPPSTWAQLEADGKALAHGSVAGVIFSANATEEGSWQFEPFFWTNGAHLSDLDSSAAIGALQYWVDLVQSGAAPRSVVNYSQADVSDQFTALHAAMMVNGSWMLDYLPSTIKYGVVPIPVPRAGVSPVSPMGGEMWAVPQTSPATEAAAQAMVGCLMSGPRMLQWDVLNSYMPTNPVLNSSFIAKESPLINVFVNEAKTARSRTADGGLNYPKISSALWTAIGQALSGRETAKAALTQAQNSLSS
ncbi:MAG TPA: sugar ABC transporter substrate-binding protein [Acidimicrobiales bacterium]|nr:sugar ABC transporter substrate-binding protein [Acidimicrobiales bacterium]